MNDEGMKNEGIENIPDTTFLVDGMLGSIARKLRILGFDTIYDSKSEDQELLITARNSGRYLVTSDIELFLLARRLKTPAILVSSRSERNRLFEVLSKAGIWDIGGFPKASRCSVCNGELSDSGRKTGGMDIFVCKNCGKDYWRGSHWKKLALLFAEVESMLAKEGERVNSEPERLDDLK